MNPPSEDLVCTDEVCVFTQRLGIFLLLSTLIINQKYEGFNLLRIINIISTIKQENLIKSTHKDKAWFA